MGCMSSPKWSKLNVENHSTYQPAPTGNRAFRCLHRLMENAEKCDLTSFSGEQLEIEVVTSLGSPTVPLISIFLECRGSSAKFRCFWDVLQVTPASCRSSDLKGDSWNVTWRQASCEGFQFPCFQIWTNVVLLLEVQYFARVGILCKRNLRFKTFN